MEVVTHLRSLNLDRCESRAGGREEKERQRASIMTSISIRKVIVILLIVGPTLLSPKFRVSAFQVFRTGISRCCPSSPAVSDQHRRSILGTIIALPWLSSIQPVPAYAAAKIKPDDAFAALLKGRDELSVADQKYLSKRDYDGLRSYLNEEATNINNYETNAGVLLESKRLDAESKKDIGTIRRYGVGADVIIMYGGLKGEIDEENENPNYSEAAKYLKRTMDSLDEVIAICRSNGF